jgi:AraC-like DNA-binding protein
VSTPSRTEPENQPSFISTQVTEARRYYFDLDPKPGREGVVVCGGCERMRSDYVIDRSDFPFSVIEFVAKGTGTLEISGATYQLAPGMTFAYGPGVAHRIRSDSATPMLKYFVAFTGKSAHQLLAGSALAGGRVVQLSSPQEVIEVFELLQREGMSEARLAPQICAALLPVLVMKIDQHAAPYGALDFRAFETYERAKRAIEEHFLSLRSAEEAARACHVDASYLCRLFRRFGRTTPYRFITKLKMNQAAALLLDQRMMVKEVADALGFADAFHFSRTFKRVYGISPERFIRQSLSRSSGS